MKTKTILFASVLLMNIFISAVSDCQWVSQNVPLRGGMMISLKFTDINHGAIGGWLVDNSIFQIQANGFYTVDGGITWNESSIADSIRSLVEMEFISGQTGFAVGAYNPPDVFGKSKNNVTDQLALNYYNRTGMTAGEQDYKAVVMKTTDGGASWFAFGKVPDSLSYIESIEISDPQNVYLSTSRQVGNDLHPGIYKTDINFQKWEKYSLPFDSGDVRKIYRNGDVIIGAGFLGYSELTSKGAVVRSGDNGLTWSLIEFPEINLFSDMRFINENTGFINGQKAGLNSLPSSIIYRTTNKGINWIRLPADLDSFMVFGIETVQNTGVVYFYANKFSGSGLSFKEAGSYIGRSFDSGNTWILQPVLNQLSMLFNCQALNSSDAYCIGAYRPEGIGKLYIDPIVLKTTNGGAVFISSDDQEIPSSYSLKQNYPNPFNPVTNLEFEISNLGFVSLKVYDVLGKEVEVIVNETLQPGKYEAQFNGANLTGGIYFYELQSGNFREVKKMVLLK